MKLVCTDCGAADIMAIRPGAEAVYEHPRDLFGLPDLRQKPVVSVPPVPDLAFCAACFARRYPKLKQRDQTA